MVWHFPVSLLQISATSLLLLVLAEITNLTLLSCQAVETMQDGDWQSSLVSGTAKTNKGRAFLKRDLPYVGQLFIF